MPRSKKEKHPVQQSAAMRWEFDPNIPTDDFLEGSKLDRTWNLQEAVENFIYRPRNLSRIAFNQEDHHGANGVHRVDLRCRSQHSGRFRAGNGDGLFDRGKVSELP